MNSQASDILADVSDNFRLFLNPDFELIDDIHSELSNFLAVDTDDKIHYSVPVLGKKIEIITLSRSSRMLSLDLSDLVSFMKSEDICTALLFDTILDIQENSTVIQKDSLKYSICFTGYLASLYAFCQSLEILVSKLAELPSVG